MVHSRPLAIVVPDEPTLLGLFVDLLEDAGYAVAVAPTFADAALLCSRVSATLLVLDSGAPLAGDVTWLETVRQIPPLATTPVIYCTTDCHFVAQHTAALQARGCFLLAKPFEIETFLVLAQYAAGQRSNGAVGAFG
jgi:DNA-binding response OmpR family regulator